MLKPIMQLFLSITIFLQIHPEDLSLIYSGFPTPNPANSAQYPNVQWVPPRDNTVSRNMMCCIV